MTQNQNYYKTSSLALVATINIYIPVFDVDKTNPRESIFIFPESEELQNIVSSFWNRTLTVTPMDYFQSLKAVKTRLYS